jgi:hypothetical protein
MENHKWTATKRVMTALKPLTSQEAETVLESCLSMVKDSGEQETT